MHLTVALRKYAPVAVALLLAGCVHSASSPAETAPAAARDEPVAAEPAVRSAELVVVDGDLERSTWALGRRLYGVPGRRSSVRMAGAVNAQLAGTLSPAAAANPVDDALIAYNSFSREVPVLRLHNAATGEDRVLDAGAYTFAWRGDGALAYFTGLEDRVVDPVRHRGNVVFRPSPSARAAPWTPEPGRYAVTAWAGDVLLVHERTDAWPNLIAVEAPGRLRMLAERAALVALSPDGSRAFVSKRPDPTPVVALLDVATGEELASFRFSAEVDPVQGQPISYVADSGSWTGDTVIAAVTTGVALFRISGEAVTLEAILGVDPDVFPLGLAEPKLDKEGRSFVAAAELTQRPRAAFARVALMECRIATRRCVLGRSGPSFLPPRPVYDPSRP